MKLEKVLKKLGIEFRRRGEHHHAREGWLQIDCPFCSPGEQRFRMGISEKSLGVSCYFCGKHLLWETLQKLTGASWRSIRKATSDLRPVHVDTRARTGGKLVPPKFSETLSRRGKRFLQSRSLDWELIQRQWGIGECGSFSGPVSNSLYIPIHYRGRVVSWTCRSLRDKWRYLSASPEQEVIEHKHLLYGEDFCTHTCIVVEGPTDVWRIGPGAVCTFGTRLTSTQLLRVSQFSVRYICFDRDALKIAEDLADQLALLPGDTHVVEIDAEDPGSMDEAEVEQLRELLK